VDKPLKLNAAVFVLLTPGRTGQIGKGILFWCANGYALLFEGERQGMPLVTWRYNSLIFVDETKDSTHSQKGDQHQAA
jgi:hypothetical protein